MNKYRVDVSSNERVTPVGMNSIKYVGDSWNTARQIFKETPVHKDAWNQTNEMYGVILSVWDGNQYIVKVSKGFK